MIIGVSQTGLGVHPVRIWPCLHCNSNILNYLAFNSHLILKVFNVRQRDGAGNQERYMRTLTAELQTCPAQESTSFSAEF